MDKFRGHVLSETKLAEVAALYSVRIASYGLVEGGYRNVSHSFTGSNGTRYNFILYKHELGIVQLIRRTNALGVHVAGKNLPVRAPADNRILQVGRRYGSLYNYLDGATIPWEAYTKKHIKLLGMAMAKFHVAASDYAGPTLPDVEDVYEDIFGRVTAYFEDTHVQRALHEKLGLSVDIPDFSGFLGLAKRLPGRTALHMDMVRSNVLFRGAYEGDALVIETLALSGILDLEKAATGHPLFDVARTLAFLLVDCPKPPEKTKKYFLDSGYRKRGGLDIKPVRIAGADMLDQLQTLFLTYDFYKFLKQNPYESLPKNHHFKRTVDILIAQKVLH